jgi:hypothetical protein
MGRSAVGHRPAAWLALSAVALAVPFGAYLWSGSASTLGPLTECRTGRPQLVVVVLDVSSSVIDWGGADPRGRSFQEAIEVAELMREQPCTSEDRFGAVIFADGSVEVPPVLVTSHSIIEASIKRPPASEIGSGTHIGPALELAAAMMARHPEHQKTVVVLSDMETKEDLSSALGRLSFDGLWLVALGDHDPRYDRYFDAVEVLGRVGVGEVGQTVVAAVDEQRGR